MRFYGIVGLVVALLFLTIRQSLIYCLRLETGDLKYLSIFL